MQSMADKFFRQISPTRAQARVGDFLTNGDGLDDAKR
jgi:hypothetical protein